MPPDSDSDRFTGLDPVSRRMCATLAGLEESYAHFLQLIEEAKAVITEQQELIATAQGGLDQLRADARKLQDAGLIMGYDLFRLMDQARVRLPDLEVGSPVVAPPTTITDPVPAEFSVKDFVLEQVRAAYPEFVTAASIQAKIKDLGHSVHPKTVGMSLYRWSQLGAIERQGKSHWFFVPEDQRTETAKHAQEASEQAA